MAQGRDTASNAQPSRMLSLHKDGTVDVAQQPHRCFARHTVVRAALSLVHGTGHGDGCYRCRRGAAARGDGRPVTRPARPASMTTQASLGVSDESLGTRASRASRRPVDRRGVGHRDAWMARLGSVASATRPGGAWGEHGGSGHRVGSERAPRSLRLCCGGWRAARRGRVGVSLVGAGENCSG